MNETKTTVQKSRRQTKIYSWTGAALVAGILVLLNFLISYLPLRLDTSNGHIYSISSGTKSVLKKLDDVMVIRIIFSDQLPPNYRLNEQYITDLLSEYRRASHGKIRVEYFNPGLSAQTRQEAMQMGVSPVQLDLRERDRREVKECFMGVALLYGDKHEAIPFVQDTQNLEYELTLRIKKLVMPVRPVIGLVSSGETLKLDSQEMQALGDTVKQQFEVRPIDLKDPVPSEIQALWVLGPTKQADSAALGHLRDYLQAGGVVGLLLDRREVVLTSFLTSSLNTGYEPLLEEWGVHFSNGLVSDSRCDRVQIRAQQGAVQFLNVVDYPYFPWVTDMDRSNSAIKSIDGFTMPFVTPLTVDKPLPQLTYKTLTRSSPASWLDTNPVFVSPLQSRNPPKDAVVGPFTLALTIEGNFNAANPQAKPGKIILFGSSRFINGAYPPRPSNYAVFMNMLDWSVQDEALLSIRSKGVARRMIRELSDGMRVIVKFFMIFGLPILSILLGVWVWRHQRLRRQLLPLHYQEK